MGNLFALEIPVYCMKIVLTSAKLYWEERENSAQVTEKLGVYYLKGLDHSCKSSTYF